MKAKNIILMGVVLAGLALGLHGAVLMALEAGGYPPAVFTAGAGLVVIAAFIGMALEGVEL